MDAALPFGLRSAPKIFNALADAMQWSLEQEGIDIIHYLDDFLITSSPDGTACERALALALEKCRKLGVPIAGHKTEGPATTITFLGIELDTVARTMRLPTEKLSRLQREIKRWTGRWSCTKRDLQSLIGLLQQASSVVRPTFLRRMIALLSVARRPHHRIRLNVGLRSDLLWWRTFLPTWNGVGMMSGAVGSGSGPMVSHLTSDASGSWGCGAYTSSGQWLQLVWPAAWEDLHITIKELLPIILGVALWGQVMGGQNRPVSV